LPASVFSRRGERASKTFVFQLLNATYEKLPHIETNAWQNREWTYIPNGWESRLSLRAQAVNVVLVQVVQQTVDNTRAAGKTIPFCVVVRWEG
jgi:hypothetical protein